MAEERERFIKVSEGTEEIRMTWGSAGLGLGTFKSTDVSGPIILGIDALDQLLDALHEVRADIAGTRRIARMLRLPVKLKNRLEAKVRREGGNQNAAIIQAIEHYLAE